MLSVVKMFTVNTITTTKDYLFNDPNFDIGNCIVAYSCC
jgi:hypothetical protein